MIRYLRNIKWILLPFGLIHLALVWLRNKFYDVQIFKTHRLPRAVISVGNIQMGGAGKTPLVMEILRLLEEKGKIPAVLSRGYGRHTRDNLLIGSDEAGEHTVNVRQVGDEPYLILRNMHKGVVGVGANRYDLGREMLQKYPVDAFVLDDGFQHRKLHRDLNICLIDVSRWSGYPFLFPFSYLRDSKSSLRRADVIILTKFENDPQRVAALKNSLRTKYAIPVMSGTQVFDSLVNLGESEQVTLKELILQKVAAVAGIANPDNFFDSLERSGFSLVYRQKYSDHHNYKAADILEVERKAREAGADWLIVTEKDAVKLAETMSGHPETRKKILVFRSRFVITEYDQFRRLIYEALNNR